MACIRDPLEDLESQRLRLEENVAKLQASLRHWQAWEIEYEGMKEEISELGKNLTPADLEKMSLHSGTTLGSNAKTTLTREERKAILWTEKGVLRKPDEIRSLLTRRTDYVQQNIKMVTSLLRTSKEKLAASTVLSPPEVLNEDGLPLMEIHEELDEEGNVISSLISEPGKTATKAVEAIETAAGGLLPKENGTKPAVLSPYGASKAQSGDPSPETFEPTLEPTTKNPPKKRLSTPVEADYAHLSSHHKASEQKLLNEISDREADELERKEMANSVVPEDELAEEAVLRRQMIQYNMDEVGSVVAEIDLEDDTTSPSEHDSGTDLGDDDDDDDDDNDEVEDDDDDEEEDQFGRTSRSKPLDEAYVKRMQKLSDRLKADATINVGPGRPTEPREGLGTSTTNVIPTGPKGVPPKKKGVRFAQDLDIQESPEPGSTSRQANGTELQASSRSKKGVRFANDLGIHEAPEVSVANLLSTSSAMTGIRVGEQIRQVHGPVVERGGAAAAAADALVNKAEIKTGKGSKFKAARAQVSTNATIAKAYNPAQEAPQAAKPSSVILAETLVERPFKAPATATVAPPDIDDLDPVLLDREVSSEYHKLRSRQIQREGGFLRSSDDQAEVPLTEEEGGPKRMSKFKAARLGLL